MLAAVADGVRTRGRARQLQRQVVRRAAARNALSLPSARMDRRAAAARRRAASGAAVLEGGRLLARSCSSSRSSARGAPDDVPGFEIPARYFQFVRSGDATPLAGVLEHNRLDLVSLAGLTARLLELVRGGPDYARQRARGAGARPCLRARRDADERAIGATSAPSRCRRRRAAAAATLVMADALRALAIALPARAAVRRGRALLERGCIESGCSSRSRARGHRGAGDPPRASRARPRRRRGCSR